MFNIFLESLSYWWPWVSLLNSSWLVQFTLVYLTFLVFTSRNIYYSLFYVFTSFFYLGLFISLLQFEFFTGFLWVVESTVILIILILFFYLNVDGAWLRFNIQTNWFYLLVYLYLTFILLDNYFSLKLVESGLLSIFSSLVVYENYYESLVNINLNEFRGLTISYYSINSHELIIIGAILLVASVLCVNLNMLQVSLRAYKYNYYFNIFYYYKDFINFTFLRKQNLTIQNSRSINLKVLNKK